MNKQELSSTYENIIFMIYIIFLGVVLYFHEPWFDEAQAWLIVRDSNLLDIIWKILRYEGHTPLWYIALYLPSTIGLPFEVGLKLVNFTFISLSTFILVKKSPFPLKVRLLLPFTYFLFYQYGVISRSYSLLALILWLIAYTMPHRNKKPLIFCILLGFLGGVTAHGMLIAFGIAVAWFIEIVVMNNRDIKISCSRKIKIILRDSRIHYLIALALVNIFYVAILLPNPDKYTPLQNGNYNFLILMIKFFVFPLNGLFMDIWPNTFQGPHGILVLMLLIGMCLTMVLFIWTLHKGMLLYCLLPYTFTGIFMSTVYFSTHHSGIYVLMIIFCLWISLDQAKFFKTTNLGNKIVFFSTSINNKRLKCFLKACVFIVFVIQISWSATASIKDIKLPYAPARNLSTFIKNNNIQGNKIFYSYDLHHGKISYSFIDISVLAYFSENIFYNHNLKQNISYATHKSPNKDKVIKHLKEVGKPDFIIEHNYPMSSYALDFDPMDYNHIATFKGFYMWKNRLIKRPIRMYIRKDLQSKYTQFVSK